MRSDWRWLQCSAIAQRVQTAKQPVHAIDAALGANNPRHRIMQSSATHRAVPCRAVPCSCRARTSSHCRVLRQLECI
ncbi:hypothetical protein XMIN_13 [Xanthomonas citri pv. mangiferaeindicae LMG 941]|nr:hypothetical protein XMIN_13 [Xanthomonas citri pv. mangiferaeindicae LMG 941]